jgi:hypothetical protein
VPRGGASHWDLSLSECPQSDHRRLDVNARPAGGPL